MRISRVWLARGMKHTGRTTRAWSGLDSPSGILVCQKTPDDFPAVATFRLRPEDSDFLRRAS